jgi:hypothetical protein
MNAIRKEDKMAPIVSRGFRGRRAADVDPARIPPGQYVTADFPVLSAGPTPHTALELWDFSIVGELAEPRGWTWEEFRALPSEEITRDIHCVTKWTKLDTVWRGVSVDTLLEGIETAAQFVTQYSDGGYTTNLPLEDVTGGKAWVVFACDGQPLEPEHGGPARMLVPHHYLAQDSRTCHQPQTGMILLTGRPFAAQVRQRSGDERLPSGDQSPSQNVTSQGTRPAREPSLRARTLDGEKCALPALIECSGTARWPIGSRGLRWVTSVRRVGRAAGRRWRR